MNLPREPGQVSGDKSEQLLWLGLYDSLTNLPNRYLFLDRLHHTRSLAVREKYGFAILMIRLDGLKSINERLGHHVGDRALATVAERLRKLARDSDTVARFGGNEFTAILVNINQPADAESIAGKYAEAIGEAITINGSSVALAPAIGVSCYPQHGEDINTLVHNSEKAMLTAIGRGAACNVYSDIDGGAVPGTLYNYDLDELFRNEQIRFLYQPICAIEDSRIVALEALCRWQHPSLGEIYPDKLILDANNSPEIKSFVTNGLRIVLQQVACWRQQNIHLPVHFNLSAYMLNDPFAAELIIDLLDESGQPPESLVIELTETEFYSVNTLTVRIIRELAARGIGIALDDFGVGFSSLSHLLEFPVDIIKIDKLFVEDIATNSRGRTITRCLVDMAHELGARVVAEGVSGTDHTAVLADLGCDFIQSHHFFKPLPAGEVEKQINGVPRGRL